MRRPSCVLVLAALCLVAGCGPLFNPPTVSVKRVDITKLDFGGISFDLVFSVNNSNVIGMDLAKLTYQLTVDRHQLVAGAANRPLHVPAQGVGELVLPVSFKFVDLAEAIMSILQKPILPYSIAVSLGFGTPIGVLTVPVSHNGNFNVPRLPSVNLASAAVGSVNMSGADVRVALSLTNYNAFVVPVSNLAYTLSLDGAAVAQAGTGPVQLGPNETHTVEVTAHADFMQAGIAIFRAVESRSAAVALDGNLQLAGISVPVHVGGRLQ